MALHSIHIAIRLEMGVGLRVGLSKRRAVRVSSSLAMPELTSALRIRFRLRVKYSSFCIETSIAIISAFSALEAKSACRSDALSNLGIGRLNITLSKCLAPH